MENAGFVSPYFDLILIIPWEAIYNWLTMSICLYYYKECLVSVELDAASMVLQQRFGKRPAQLLLFLRDNLDVFGALLFRKRILPELAECYSDKIRSVLYVCAMCAWVHARVANISGVSGSFQE